MSDRDGVRAGAAAWLVGSVTLLLGLALLPALRVGTLVDGDAGSASASSPARAAIAELLAVLGVLVLLAGFAKWEHALRRSTQPLAAHLGYAMGMTLVIVVIVEAAAGLGVNSWLLRTLEDDPTSSAGIVEAAQAIDAARLGALLVAFALLAAATALAGVGAWYDVTLPRWLGGSGFVIAMALLYEAVAAAFDPPADPMRAPLGVLFAVTLLWGVGLYAMVLRVEERTAANGERTASTAAGVHAD